MIGKILVPIDSSPIAAKAANVAIDLAKKNEAEMMLISVVQLPEHAGTIGEVVEAKAEGEKRVGRQLLKTQHLAQESGVKAKAKLLFGHPTSVIVKYAREGNFDLIVMGHKGASSVQRFLLGSTSIAVSERAPCTVMLVK